MQKKYNFTPNLKKAIKEVYDLDSLDLIQRCKKAEMELELIEIRGDYVNFDDKYLEKESLNYVLNNRALLN